METNECPNPPLVQNRGFPTCLLHFLRTRRAILSWMLTLKVQDTSTHMITWPSKTNIYIDILYTHTYLEPKWPLSWAVDLPFYVSNLPKKGHLGSRVYTYNLKGNRKTKIGKYIPWKMLDSQKKIPTLNIKFWMIPKPVTVGSKDL